MRKIFGIGETVMDIIFKNDKPTTAIPGGSTFNSLISLGRSAAKLFPDIQVYMITEMGDDHIGDIICSFMNSNGVVTDYVSRNNGKQSPIALGFLDSENVARYEFYRDNFSSFSGTGFSLPDVFSKDDIVLFGSFFAVNPVIRNFTRSLISKARNSGSILYYDVNFRKNHASELDSLISSIKENISMSDFVRGSIEDFGLLFGTEDPSRIYNEHIRPLCSNFICTCGPDPIHVFSNDMHLEFPVSQIDTISTIGAGDSFNAGFVFSLINKGFTKDNVNSLDESKWSETIRIAERFSANVCGSIFNYIDEDLMNKISL